MIISGRVRSLRHSALPFVLLTLFLLPALILAGPPGASAAGTELVSGRMLRYTTSRGRVELRPDLAVSGRLLVQFRTGVGQASVAASVQRSKGAVLHSFRTPGLYLVALPAGQKVADAARAWRADPNVRLAEPDRLAYAQRVPNDPLYSQQYHQKLIGCETAWDSQRGSPATKIAVLDTGVDLTHEDLAPRIWVNPGEVPNNGVDDDGNGYIDDVNGYDFIDDDGDPDPDTAGTEATMHGTHVAGICAAATDNGVGIAGVDWNARIIAVRVLNGNGAGAYSSIIAGIEYATVVAAEVVNMSLGGPYSDILTAPISAAWAAGTSVVCAAGNEGEVITDDSDTWRSPLCNDGDNLLDNHIVGVGATDSGDLVASFSNVDGSSHKFVDVMAPGVDIFSTYLYRPGAGWDTPYGLMSGTSMACPVTAGVVALLRAQFPGFGPDQIMAQLRQGCQNIDGLNPGFIGMMGAGRVYVPNSLGDMPPGAPRSVQAFDTPDTEANSITVIWNTSLDDGRGANDVIGYEVQRALDVAGPFTSLTATLLPPGTKSYEDTTVQKLTDYYYRVVAHDAVNATASKVAGPAQTLDDVAPLAVTVTANDTAGDDGGSISLSWASYAQPGDFASYRIYRATTNFSRVDATGVVLLATVTSAGQKTYQDRGTIANPIVDNTDYWYAVTCVDTSGNELKVVTAAGPARANPNATVTVPMGVSMVSLPLQPTDTDLGNIFGNPAGIDFARWDPTSSASNKYVVYSTASATERSGFLGQQLGKGFWVRAPQAQTVTLSGGKATTATGADFAAGWNQLGNPYTDATDITGAQVVVGGTSYDLGTSNASGYTADYFWAYDGYSASYQLISTSFSFARTNVRKGEAFFFLANRTGKLVLPLPGTAVVAQAKSGPSAAAGDWALRLQASTNGAADTDNFLGVSARAAQLNGVCSPPVSQDGVDLYFPSGSGHSATSFVSELGAGQQWELRVACQQPGQTVQLTWPDLSQLPRGYRPLLIDQVTGRKVYLRTTRSYSFTLAAGEAERAFSLEINSQTGDLLVIGSLQANANANTVQIAYSLSDAAAVSIEILNVAGRTVRVLPPSQQSAGAATSFWDGRNASGVRVPAGNYLVRLTARSDSGQSASAVRTLQLR